jgi:hypothetical protein
MAILLRARNNIKISELAAKGKGNLIMFVRYVVLLIVRTVSRRECVFILINVSAFPNFGRARARDREIIFEHISDTESQRHCEA